MAKVRSIGARTWEQQLYVNHTSCSMLVQPHLSLWYSLLTNPEFTGYLNYKRIFINPMSIPKFMDLCVQRMKA